MLPGVPLKPGYGDLYAGTMSDSKFQAFNNEHFWTREIGIRGNKKRISTIMETGSMKGESAFIIAGGYSSSMFDLRKLDKYFTIGCNFVWRFYECNVDIFADYTVVDDRMLPEKKFIESKSVKLLVDVANFKWDYYYTRPAGFMGYSTDVDLIYCASNTGFMAVQFAIALGCNPIYLIGFDFKFHQKKNGKEQTHCLSDWLAPQEYDKTLKRFCLELNLFWDYFRNGTQLINLSPVSLATFLPFKNFDEVVN